MDFLQLGNTAIKGGIFFGNQLTPSGVFKNVPDSYQPDVFAQDSTINGQTVFNRCSSNVELTLDKLKESLANSLAQQDITISDKLFREFLSNSAKLLIDYRDLRNFVFFGSAYTELSYNLVNLINNYPYKAYIASSTGSISVTNLDNKTYIEFTNAEINKGNEVFNLKESQTDNLINFVLVDKNGNQYKVLDYESPIYNPITVVNLAPTGVEITTANPHGYTDGLEIKIKKCNIPELNNDFFVEVIDATHIRLYQNASLTSPKVLVSAVIYDGLARIREKVPVYGTTYGIRLVIEGNLTPGQYISLLENLTTYEGFLLQRNNQYYIEFNNTTTDFQKQLLNKTITKPWPREVVTDNILFKTQEFDEWILDPGNFRLQYNYEDDPGFIENYYSDLNTELVIASAMIMDEDETNQLLRKAFPSYVIDELRDQDAMFKRFILIAGWLFDQIKLYINFIAYNHHLNYTPYNQLTYQYYDLYAKHFGLELFEEDNIELSKLLVQTEPGLIYINNQPEFQDQDNAKTLYLLQKEKQKRLLINLLYLYKGKGTLGILNKLIDLLGVPQGLVQVNEFYFDFLEKDANGTPTSNKKVRLIDNEKVKTPGSVWEIDPNSLLNNSNIPSTANQPYFYKQALDNQWQINLREIDLITSPQDAFLHDLIRWGQQTYPYCKFKEGGFCYLQNTAKPYYMLPLSFPDKYCGFTFEYLIPKQTLNPVKNQFTLASLFHVASLGTMPELLPAGNRYNYFRERFGFYNQASFSITDLLGGGTIEVKVLGQTIVLTTDEETIPQTSKKLCNIINTSAVAEKFFASYENGIITISSRDIVLNGESLEIISDFLIGTQTDFTDTTSALDDNYIICRIENSKLVVRLRYVDEFNPNLPDTRFDQRVAISQYVFNDDGLNHRMELKLRPAGIELYQDFRYIEFIPWRNLTPTQELYWTARDLPLNEVVAAPLEKLDITYFAEPTNTGDDAVRWWDLFVGDPHRIDVWVKEVQVYENREINQDNLQTGGQSDDSNYSVEGYIFKANITNNNFDAYYQSPFPLIDGEDVITNILPVDNDNKVESLNLIPYSSFEDNDSVFEKTKQDFYYGIDLTTTINKLYQLKGWDDNLHKQEEYEVLQAMLINYFVFGRQIITYTNLISIIQLIEKKFKILSAQFIPIVVNTNNFSRLIQPEVPDKFRYHGAYKNCVIDNLGRRASLRIDLLGSALDGEFSMDLAPYGNSGTITWEQSDFYTLKKLGEVWKNIANPDKMSYRVSNYSIWLEIDLGWLKEDWDADQSDLAGYRDTMMASLVTTDMNFTFHDWDIGQIPSRPDVITYAQMPCFQVEYTLPNQEVDDNFYIYYDNEDDLIGGPQNHIYYNSETGKYYRFIK